MKNLLNNISQEEKERILEMHKKNITIISEQEKVPAGININGVEYFNPNITSEAKLNAFLDTGNLTRENFPSIKDRLLKKISSDNLSNTEINEIFRTYETDKIPKFVKNYLIFIAKQKRNPIDISSIGRHFKGPFKIPYESFRTFTTSDGKTYAAVVEGENLGNFELELFNLIQRQTAKAKRA
jgi:hypothetical protein